MKIFKGLFFTVAAFFIFSCTQLNLKNPVGAVNVSLPSSSRMIIEEGQTVNSFEKINYLISLYSSSGALVDKKMALEGSSVTFPDVAEGSYVVKAFCNTTSNGKEECIAAGFKSAEVKGGEVTPVTIELSYNRPDKIDVNRSSIKYTGKTEFSSENEMAAYVSDSFKDFLSAEIVFTNGWAEVLTANEASFSVEEGEKVQVPQMRGEPITFEGTGGPTETIVSGGKEAYQFKVICTLYENITKESIVILYVVKKQQIEEPVVPDLTVGLSEGNPCMNSEDLLSAITNAQSNATIYIGGEKVGSDYIFLMTQTHAITKNLTIKSAVDNLIVKRNSGTYITIGSGCQLDINTSSSDKKIVFNDAETGITSNYIMGDSGTLVAYNVEFNTVSWGAIKVRSAELHGCSFNNISSEYAAIYVNKGCSATVDGCTFSGNTSAQNSGYGDIYLAKEPEDTTLTLSGTVTTDIGIYVENSSYGDPEIDVTGIDLSSNKLNIKLSYWPEAESITLFVKNNVNFTSVSDMDSKFTFVVSPDITPTMPIETGDGHYMTSLDGTGKEYMIVKY